MLSAPRVATPLRGAGRDAPGKTQPRAPKVDDATKGGSFGERVKGPHKPTLDEMGPHASTSVPLSKDLAPRRVKSVDVEDGAEKKARRGRTKKTGRPGM